MSSLDILPRTGGNVVCTDWRLSFLTHAYPILALGVPGLGTAVLEASIDRLPPVSGLVPRESNPATEPDAIPQSWVPGVDSLAMIAR